MLAVAYLLGYGAGNLLAMGGFAWMIGAGSAWMGETGTYRVVLGGCSAAAIVVGVAWLVL